MRRLKVSSSPMRMSTAGIVEIDVDLPLQLGVASLGGSDGDGLLFEAGVAVSAPALGDGRVARVAARTSETASSQSSSEPDPMVPGLGQRAAWRC
jgi:hypothetical protein